MVSLAMSAIGVVVLIVAVDGGHNRQAVPKNMENGIWNLSRKDPDCEEQKKKGVGEAKDGENCGPASQTLFARKADLPNAIQLCCQKHLLCIKGGKDRRGINEWKCRPPHHA